jgi:hypothetical protein
VLISKYFPSSNTPDGACRDHALRLIE